MKSLKQIISLLGILLFLLVCFPACSQAARDDETTDTLQEENTEEIQSEEETKDIPAAPQRIIREEETFTNKDTTWKTYTEYKYDDTNNTLEKYRYDEDANLTDYYVEKYDSNGNVLTYAWYNADGTIQEETIFSYNEMGQEITSNYLTRAGAYTLENTYDESGNLSKTIRSGDRNTYTDYEYNDKGQIISSKEWLPSGDILHETDYTYDDDGYLLEEITTYLNIQGELKKEYTYNGSGEKVKEATFSSGKLIESYEYEYDDRGNLVILKYDIGEETDVWWSTELYTYEYEDVPS